MLITPEMVRAARERLSVPVVLIVDEAEDILIDYAVSQLRRVLAQLDAMTPLAPACSEEALANHEAWMKQSEQMNRLAREAECIALTTVPPEIASVLHVIGTRELVKRGIITREDGDTTEQETCTDTLPDHPGSPI